MFLHTYTDWSNEPASHDGCLSLARLYKEPPPAPQNGQTPHKTLMWSVDTRPLLTKWHLPSVMDHYILLKATIPFGIRFYQSFKCHPRVEICTSPNGITYPPYWPVIYHDLRWPKHTRDRQSERGHSYLMCNYPNIWLAIIQPWGQPHHWPPVLPWFLSRCSG